MTGNFFGNEKLIQQNGNVEAFLSIFSSFSWLFFCVSHPFTENTFEALPHVFGHFCLQPLVGPWQVYRLCVFHSPLSGPLHCRGLLHRSHRHRRHCLRASTNKHKRNRVTIMYDRASRLYFLFIFSQYTCTSNDIRIYTVYMYFQQDLKDFTSFWPVPPL